MNLSPGRKLLIVGLATITFVVVFVAVLAILKFLIFPSMEQNLQSYILWIGAALAFSVAILAGLVQISGYTVKDIFSSSNTPTKSESGVSTAINAQPFTREPDTRSYSVGNDLPPTMQIRGIEYVLIQGGRAIIGSDLIPEERPVHEVIVKPYYISRYPITVQGYLNFIDMAGWPWTAGWNHQLDKKDKLDHPATHVSWFDAIQYCNWAGVKLPTEVQWEHACRGAELWLYPWGNTWLEMHCNSAELMIGHTTPVSTFQTAASPFGIIDMLGNVWEWCNTRWGRTWEQCDFKYPYLGDDGREIYHNEDLRVLRGGSWKEYCSIMRATYRERKFPSTAADNIGFRCVYEPDFRS